MKRLRLTALAGLAAAAAGCSTPVGDYLDSWFGSGPAIKPAALVQFKESAAARVLWRAEAGAAEKAVFAPFVGDTVIFTAASNGTLTRIDGANGRQLGRFEAKTRLTGGVGGDRRMVVVGSSKGEVLAFDYGGKPLWTAQINSDVLSAPRIESDVVVVRSGDGRLFGFDAASGSRRWVYQRTLPPLTVRTHVGVQTFRGGLFAGFPGGRLVALSAATGNVAWEATVALPKGSTELERVADVSSLPVTDGRQVCAAAYQGRVACFGLTKGELLWARDFSSVSGITMDARAVYGVDDKSAVVAFDRNSGASLWKQDKLYGRNVSAPIVVGRFLAVGDYQGYVHFLSREDGSFVARIATDGGAIVARPEALDDHLLVQTLKGGVYAIAVQ